MNTRTFYLLYVLIEMQESTSCCHTLYHNLKDAQAVMQDEIAECKENFTSGKAIRDYERCYEFRNEDGYGYTVGIDELKPI